MSGHSSIWIKSNGCLYYASSSILKCIDLNKGIVHVLMPVDSSIWLLRQWREQTEVYIGFVDGGRSDVFENTTLLLWMRSCEVDRLEVKGFCKRAIRHVSQEGTFLDTILIFHGEMSMVGDDRQVVYRLGQYTENVIGGEKFD